MQPVMTPTLPMKSIRQSSPMGHSSDGDRFMTTIGEQRAKADCERELIAIHRGTAERERL